MHEGSRERELIARHERLKKSVEQLCERVREKGKRVVGVAVPFMLGAEAAMGQELPVPTESIVESSEELGDGVVDLFIGDVEHPHDDLMHVHFETTGDPTVAENWTAKMDTAPMTFEGPPLGIFAKQEAKVEEKKMSGPPGPPESVPKPIRDAIMAMTHLRSYTDEGGLRYYGYEFRAPLDRYSNISFQPAINVEYKEGKIETKGVFLKVNISPRS